MQFEDLKLIEPLLRGVRQEGYTNPTPIQEQAIPHVLQGLDMLGCAQTGTGKTAAFALPILQRLAAASGNGHAKGTPYIRALVLAPTRELATQIGESFRAYGRHTGLRHTTIYGGVGQNPQVAAVRKGVDILVATPGRLLDLMGQGYIKLDKVEIFVLDEADRMLDMGFVHDVERIVNAVPRKRQTLMFSATMPPDILKLANAILTNPVSVSVAPAATTVELTTQHVYAVEKGNKPALLKHLLDNPAVTRALVFTRTKHGANKVVRQLGQSRITAEPIHSNKSQAAREKALSNFKNGRTRVLVATDIAARGIDVDNITHVINFDLPNEPETYVHRIGRTGRAGQTGIALSFCSPDERDFLRDIERLIRQKIDVVRDHPYVSANGQPLPAAATEDHPTREHRPPRYRPDGQSSGSGEREGSSGNRRRRRRGGRGGAPASRPGQPSADRAQGGAQAGASQGGPSRGGAPKGPSSNGGDSSRGDSPRGGSSQGNGGQNRRRNQPSGGSSGRPSGGAPHGGSSSRPQGSNQGGSSSGGSREQTPPVTPTAPRTAPVRRPRLVR